MIEVTRDRHAKTVQARVCRLKDGEEGTTLSYAEHIVDVGAHPRWPSEQRRTSLALKRLRGTEALPPHPPSRRDLKAVLLLHKIAAAVELGEKLTIAQLIKRLDMSKGSTSYDILRELLPAGQLVEIALGDVAQTVRRLTRSELPEQVAVVA